MKLTVLQRQGAVTEFMKANSLPHLVVKQGDLGIVLSYANIPSASKDLTIDVSLMKDGEPVPTYCNTSTGEFIQFFESHRRRDNDSFMAKHNFAPLLASLAKLGNELYIVSAVPVDVQCPATIAPATPFMSTLRTLEAYNPAFGNHAGVIKRRARYEVMHAINPDESLSDLEKQVDILSELVLQVCSLIPEESRPALTQKVEQIMSNAATRQKSIDECVDDVMKQKSQIRAALNKYYAVKSNNA